MQHARYSKGLGRAPAESGLSKTQGHWGPVMPCRKTPATLNMTSCRLQPNVACNGGAQHTTMQQCAGGSRMCRHHHHHLMLLPVHPRCSMLPKPSTPVKLSTLSQVLILRPLLIHYLTLSHPHSDHTYARRHHSLVGLCVPYVECILRCLYGGSKQAGAALLDV